MVQCCMHDRLCCSLQHRRHQAHSQFYTTGILDHGTFTVCPLLIIIQFDFQAAHDVICSPGLYFRVLGLQKEPHTGDIGDGR